MLLAVSDNGAQMTLGSTREFMALHAIACQFGRPGVPTDQAPIESFLGHLKTEWPQLEAIDDQAALAADLHAIRHHYNTVRLHAAIGYVTPADEHAGRGADIRHARRLGPQARPPPAHRLPSQPQASTTLMTPRTTLRDRRPDLGH